MENRVTYDVVFSVICNVIAKELDVRPDQIGPDCDLHRDLGATSLELMEIEMSLEEQFKIESLTDAERNSVQDVSDLVRIFCQRIGDGTATLPEEGGDGYK